LEDAAVLPVREIWVDSYRYNGEGIGIRGKETEVQILGPKKWYREQTGREPKEK